MKKLLLIATLAALAGGGWFAKKRDWFGMFKQSDAAAQDDVTTAASEKKDIDFSIHVSGDVMPDTQLDVKAEVGGRIKVLHVEPGTMVKAGEVLVEIDDTDIRSEMDSAKTEGAKLAVTKAERNFERAKDLFDEKLIIQEAYDNLSSELDIAKNTYTKAEKKMQLVQDKLNKTKVFAPGDGTVLTVPVVEGQVAIAAASVNSGTTLMSIANISKLIVETHVNQVDVSRLTPKQKVHLVAFQLYENEDNRIARLKQKKPVLRTRSGKSYNPYTLKNTSVIIPFTTFYYDYSAANIVGLVDQGPIQEVDGLTIQAVDAEHVQDAIDEVSALLTQTHRGVEDFTFDTRQELAESIEKPASSTPLSGALIVGISLYAASCRASIGCPTVRRRPCCIRSGCTR